MVSVGLLALSVVAVSAQVIQPPLANGFRGARQDQLAPPPKSAQPKIAATPEMRGDIYMARKMYREAIEKYLEVPETAIIANKIGIAYHQMMDLKTARKYYERAVKLDSHYPEAINNIGTVLYSMKRYNPAIRQYKKAIKLSPRSASIHSNLGTAYFAKHKFKDAVQAYETAMSLDPDVFEHRGTYGVLLQERAVDDLAMFHYYLAKLYAEKGLSEQAMIYIRKALEEGFKERQRFREEPEFTNLQKLPEFQALLELHPRVL